LDINGNSWKLTALVHAKIELMAMKKNISNLHKPWEYAYIIK
jgi:hypothetical protein